MSSEPEQNYQQAKWMTELAEAKSFTNFPIQKISYYPYSKINIRASEILL